MPLRIASSVAALACLSAPLFAAPDAGAKARGEFNFYSHSLHGNFQSAQTHITHYQNYLDDVGSRPVQPSVSQTATGGVNPLVAREAGDTIGDFIERMQRHSAAMRRRATTLGDKQALAVLDDIDRNLTEAERHHAALEEHHDGPQIDAATAKQHCDSINAAIRKASEEHDAIMQKLDRATSGRQPG